MTAETDDEMKALAREVSAKRNQTPDKPMSQMTDAERVQFLARATGHSPEVVAQHLPLADRMGQADQRDVAIADDLIERINAAPQDTYMLIVDSLAKARAEGLDDALRALGQTAKQ